MKALHAVFLLIVAIDCHSQEPFVSDQSTADNPLFRIAKAYFRSNPYNIHFSAFLNHLINDPTLSNKTISKRTDTSLFFFKGDYGSHNPFGFQPSKVEIRLAERKVSLEDSLNTTDTILFYQLIGYAYGLQGEEAIKKEFSRFDRKYGKNFYGEDSELEQGDKVIGLIKNYFSIAVTFLSPLSISWAKLDDNQSLFAITFRIKVMQNEAALPVSPDYR